MNQDKLTAIITAARLEWERDCKDAYELGLFDISLDQWISNCVGDVLQTKTTRTLLEAALVEVADYIEGLDCGYWMPDNAYDRAEMVDILAQRLNLEIV